MGIDRYRVLLGSGWLESGELAVEPVWLPAFHFRDALSPSLWRLHDAAAAYNCS
jgi:hypothetical protein